MHPRGWLSLEGAGTPAGGLQARVKFGAVSLDFSALGAQLLCVRAGGAWHPSLIQTQPGRFYLPKPREQSFQKLLGAEFPPTLAPGPFTGSQNGRVGQGPPGPSLQALLQQDHPEQGAQDRVQAAFGALRGWRPVPVLRHLHSPALCPDLQTETACRAPSSPCNDLHQDRPNPSVSPSFSRTRCDGFWSEHARVSPRSPSSL